MSALPRRLVLIEWWDAVGQFEMEAGEHLLPMLIRTVGFIYEHNENYITVIAELCGEEDEYRHVTTVPRSLVVREVELAPRYKTESL